MKEMGKMSNMFMRFPSGRKKALTFSYDDGLQQDEKLIAIMIKNGLYGTFNINSGGFAYPNGVCTDEVVEALRACHFSYARTIISSKDFKIPSDWLRLQPTCHHLDSNLTNYGKQFIENEPKRDSWLFYVWGHTYELDDRQSWSKIEEFAEYIGNHGDIWYATNIEIVDYVNAYKRLEFSMDGKRVYNPTSTYLYMEIKGKIISVKPGEEKEILI